tara:strand:- start:7452 stop:8066 length:615 start_codon:yes stop_codon:yes gene_type:complete
MNEFQKQTVFLRGWLNGRGYYNAIAAMEFARQHHTGTRKDGCTPEFQHQTEIAMHISVLPGLLFPEETIATAFLHDTVEDTPVSRHEIASRFGEQVADATWRVTKVDEHGEKRDEDALFAEMELCPIASIVKPADRIHNQRTMGGVFTQEKMISYIDFTRARILPMMKQARVNFPQQYPAYQLLRHALTTQARIVSSLAQQQIQ